MEQQESIVTIIILCTLYIGCTGSNQDQLECVHYESHTNLSAIKPLELGLHCNDGEFIMVKRMRFLDSPVKCREDPIQKDHQLSHNCDALLLNLTNNLRNECNMKSFCWHKPHRIRSNCIPSSVSQLSRVFIQVLFQCLKKDTPRINGCPDSSDSEEVRGNDVHITTKDYPNQSALNSQPQYYCLCNISAKANFQLLDAPRTPQVNTSNMHCPLTVEMPRSETICTGNKQINFEEQTHSVNAYNWSLQIRHNSMISQMRYFMYITSTSDSGTVMSVTCKKVMIDFAFPNVLYTSTQTTVDISSEDKKSDINGAIIGGSVVGAVLVILVFSSFLFCMKTKRWPFNTKPKSTEQELGYAVHANANVMMAQNDVQQEEGDPHNQIIPYAYTQGARPDLLENAIPNVYSEVYMRQDIMVAPATSNKLNSHYSDADITSQSRTLQELRNIGIKLPVQQHDLHSHNYVNAPIKSSKTPSRDIPSNKSVVYKKPDKGKSNLQHYIPNDTQMIENELYNS